MVMRASGVGMGVGLYSRPWRGVGVVAIPEVRLNTMRHVESVCEVPPATGVLRLLVLSMVVGAIIERCCVAAKVEVTR